MLCFLLVVAVVVVKKLLLAKVEVSLDDIFNTANKDAVVVGFMFARFLVFFRLFLFSFLLNFFA